MSSLKILAAAAAAASFSLAIAQGTPPQPASDPATGAGQRSTQNTPMGMTGTPGGTGAVEQGSTAGAATAPATGATAGSTAPAAGATAGSTAPAMGTAPSSAGAMGAAPDTTMNTTPMRKARADRG